MIKLDKLVLFKYLNFFFFQLEFRIKSNKI